MFWLIFWLLSLFIFLIFPAICVEDNRKRWTRRIRECRWNVDQPATTAVDTSRASHADGFHYVLSKAQEDEIREHFLLDKLKNYTQELEESDILRPRMNSSVLDEDDETPFAKQEALLNELRDLEEGVVSTGITENEENTATDGNTVTEKEEEQKDDAECKVDISDSAHDMKAETLKDMEEGTVASAPAVETKPRFPPGASSMKLNLPPSPTTQQSVDADDVSDSGTSDGEMMDIHSFDGNNDGNICLPVAGECRRDALPKNVKGNTRTEPNGCAICLSHFEAADKVTWSSNPACQHVFHDDCIKDWFMAAGRKHLKRQRREQRRTGNLSYSSNPVAKITGFPMLCPCCRQPFIMPEDEDESDDEKPPVPEITNDTEAMMIASS